MQKLLFTPFRIIGSLIAAALSKRAFGAIWGVVDKHAPPEPEQRRIDMRKLALALALDGAVVRLVRGLVDHGARRSFQRVTGRWPGEDAPAPAEHAPAEHAPTEHAD